MVTPQFPPDLGGVERHVYEVSTRLAAAGCDVSVLCTDRSGRRTGTEVHDGVRVERVRAWPASKDYFLAPGLWRAMARSEWDIVHVQSYHTAVAPLAMWRAITLRTPFVVTFHGGGHSSVLRNRVRPAHRRALRPLLRRAAQLVAVARFEIDMYGRELGLPAERFALIPNGVEMPAQTAVTREPIVATIGRLERYKGHNRVLESFPLVLGSRPDARLWIVGEGPQEMALRRRAADLGVADHVEFIGVPMDEQQTMASLLAQVGVVVCMSEFETHPLVVLEAAASGIVPLVADTSGLRELAEDGLAAAIPLGSSREVIAQAIIQRLESPEPPPTVRLASWDDCASGLLGLYRSVVHGSRRIPYPDVQPVPATRT
jgi:glycosyltransferase involved in cell wall biosynthesis